MKICEEAGRPLCMVPPLSWAGVAFTLALTLGHVIEIYFWLEPTMMPAFCYFKILRPNKSRLKVRRKPFDLGATRI